MRVYIRKVIGFLNPALLLAPIIPLVYCFGFADDLRIGYELYFKSFLVIIPIIAIDYLEIKCRHFVSYILGSLLTLAIMIGLMYLLGPVVTGEAVMSGIIYIMAIEIIAVFIYHFKIRMQLVEMIDEKGEASRKELKDSIFTRPSRYSFILFAFYYFLAMGFMSRQVCNEVLMSSILYIFIFVINEFLAKTDQYLDIHKDVAGIPKRRVYGIGAGLLGAFILILLISVIPSVTLINKRPYYDLRNLLNSSELVTYEQDPFMVENSHPQGDDGGLAELLSAEDDFEWPAWAQFLTKVIIGAITFGALGFAIVGLIKFLARFEDSFGENDDIVEKLVDEDNEKIEFTGISIQGVDQETKKIRKQYKKVIRKARKEIPAPFESPEEMEKIAGIEKQPEIQALHREYERVRYSNNDN